MVVQGGGNRPTIRGEKKFTRGNGDSVMLTRKMLKAMGIGDDQVDQIMDAHGETVDALKEQRDQYKADAEKLPDVQRELDELKSEGDGGYKKKYEDEHAAFEKYKAGVAEEKEIGEKKSMYRELLKSNHVDEGVIDSIIEVTDFKGLKAKDGKFENHEELSNSIKSKWAKFISATRVDGVDVDNPPPNGDPGKEKTLDDMSMEEYIAARKKM